MSGFPANFCVDTRLNGLCVTGRDEAFLPGREETPFDHQLETRRAIRDGAEAIVNTNPTGAGKTRAWVAPTLRAPGSTDDDQGEFVIAVYPTNALLRDQASTIRELVVDYFAAVDDATVESDTEPVVTRGEGGDEVSAPVSKLVRTVSGGETTGSTAEALTSAGEDANRLARAGLPLFVLTTPDTFTLAGLEKFYHNDIGGVPALADRIVVDEFHLAAPRGRRLLPFVLALYHRLGIDPPQFVFLSATPGTHSLDRLECLFDTTTVKRPVVTQPSTESVTHQILPSAQLHVDSCRLFRAGDWLAERAEELLAWATDDQLLVIVDSVREVETVYDALVDRADDREIGRIYGWKREGRQETVENADVIVGNTAMEVGVDFDRVSRVVATAHDAAGAIQRLGRMRHRDAVDDYEIALLTSPDIVRAVREAGEPLGRPTLEQMLFNTFDPLTAAPFYDVLLAAMAYDSWDNTNDGLGSVIHESHEQTYRETVADAFSPGLEAIYSDRPVESDPVWTEAEELRELFGANNPIFEELRQYRSSSISVAVLDETDDEERIKTTALRSLLRNRRCTILEDREHLEDHYESAFGPITDSDAARLDDVESYVVGYARVYGFREEPGRYGLSNVGFDYEQSGKRDGGAWYEPYPMEVSPRVDGPNEARACRIDLSAVLCYELEDSVSDVRSKHRLGPYANVVEKDSKTIALWDDALLAYAREVTDRLRKQLSEDDTDDQSNVI